MKFCETCGEEREFHVEDRQETYPVLDEPITVTAKVAVCNVCGTTLYDMDLDDENLERAYRIYRQKYHLLSPEEITSIREKYGLSQRAMSRLLGWGDITLHRYEKGTRWPDRVHNDMLRLLADPHTMRQYISLHRDQLSERDRTQVETALESLSEESATVIA